MVELGKQAFRMRWNPSAKQSDFVCVGTHFSFADAAPSKISQAQAPKRVITTNVANRKFHCCVLCLLRASDAQPSECRVDCRGSGARSRWNTNLNLHAVVYHACCIPIPTTFTLVTLLLISFIVDVRNLHKVCLRRGGREVRRVKQERRRMAGYLINCHDVILVSLASSPSLNPPEHAVLGRTECDPSPRPSQWLSMMCC
jgi:hypothetical protein